MSQKSRLRPVRWLLGAGFVVVVALAALDRGLQRSAETDAFPEEQGRLRVNGVSTPLEILRDARGVPHVEAAEEAGAFFGLGFAHAQDRLAQMLWLRRLAQGRTAEWAGPAAVADDRWARTLGLAALAEAELASLDGDTLRTLEAYAGGVNAGLARVREGRVAPPRVLQDRVVPAELVEWSPVDSLAVLKLYAWGLSGSVEASLALDDLMATLGSAGSRPFFPESSREDDHGPPSRSGLTAGLWRDPLRAAAGLEGRAAGSSAWVLGGAHSESGLPLLAADAHLEPTVPALLYLAHVRGGGLDVAGSTLPGVPGFWTGHNRRVAWASTHARAAVVDLYREKLHEDGEDRYHDGRRWRPLEVREERIAVRGAGDVSVRVRATHHGPLLDDVVTGRRDPLALGWVGQLGHGGATVAALRNVALASSADALVAALEGLAEPALAVVFADADGAVGLQVAGWIPRRTLATKLVPVPGRARWFDWDGRIPFEDLPAERLRDGRGWLVAADNALRSRGAKGPEEWLWRTGTRARRIDSRLRDAAASGPVSLHAMTALQNDVRDESGAALVEAALGLLGEQTLADEAEEVVGLLRGWSGDSSPQSVGAAAYHVFLVALTDALLRERLGDELLARYLAVPQADPTSVVAEIVREAAGKGGTGGWSDAERVREAVRDSLRETWLRLSYRLGGSRAKWRWGRLHRVDFRHLVPGAAWTVPGPFPMGGSGRTVNTQEYAPNDPFDVRLASTFRFAVDTAALDRSLAALAPGQSEHPGHRHYADGLAPWLEGRATILPTARVLVEESVVHRLLLEPADP
ncbi:MAG: penicillin acylase family protein [Myxococcota bacterium]|nr:penicillin acylase family protein [Myxococcota bacterium]